MRPAKEVIQEIGQTALSLLEEQGIAMEQCVGAGIGVPGTVDRKNGVVRYSNNIKWEDVDIAKEMGACLPILIYIANDADCAALGEAAAGAGRGCEDVILFTLGTGVGGGVILDGSIYEGSGISGSELGPGRCRKGADAGRDFCGGKGGPCGERGGGYLHPQAGDRHRECGQYFPSPAGNPWRQDLGTGGCTDQTAGGAA